MYVCIRMVIVCKYHLMYARSHLFRGGILNRKRKGNVLISHVKKDFILWIHVVLFVFSDQGIVLEWVNRFFSWTDDRDF